MLTTNERGAVLHALEEWAEAAPDEPMVGFIGSERLKTPREIVEDVKKESPDGLAVMEMIEHGIRRMGLNEALSRLRNRSKSVGGV